MSNFRVLLSLFCGFFAIQNAFAQVSEFQGQTSSGAYYKIAVPQNWQPQNGLVIWNHGYQGYTKTEPQANPSLGPLEDTVLAQGYALAASSFSQTGWAVFNSHIDNQQLYEKFLELVGQPQKIFIQGASMGGIVSMRDLEAGLIPDVDAAFLMCGAVAGPENWINAFDLRMVYEAVCSSVSGAELPTDSWFEQPGLVTGELDFLDSLERCTGLISSQLVGGALGALLRSPAQNERLSKILDLTQTDIDFLLLDLGYAVFEIPNLVNDPAKLNGRLPFGNADIDYGDEEINSLIQRSVALPSSRLLFSQNYTPLGSIGETKVVSIHTSKDGLVGVENQQSLRNLLAANQLTTAIVVEDEASHCGFSADEGLAAWNGLLGWVEGGLQPTAQSIQNTCQLNNSDPAQCRYDPDFAIGDSLLYFPRSNGTAILGTNSYDNGTAVLSLESLKVEGEPGNYNLQLLQSAENASVFNLGEVETIAEPGSWQHQPLFITDSSLLYVPGLRVLPYQQGDVQYDVYMQYSNAAGQARLELLEYEPSDD